MEIRAMAQEEQKYTYRQSMQIQGQTGSIGYLRGDFGSRGNDFYTTWNDHRQSLKTEEFQAEYDDVINALRSKEYGLLEGRSQMSAYAGKFPDSGFQGNCGTEYGFRVDTEKHAYLIRCNPIKGDYNFYCFCYVKEWLDSHMKKARQGIRFINPHYKELFRIPDGEKILITTGWGEKNERVCRFIDECHSEIGSNLYHICEFAERMEQSGATYEPVKAEPQKNKNKETPSGYDAATVSINSTGAVMLAEDAERRFAAIEEAIGGAGRGPIEDETPTFEQAETRENIASGDILGVILGKIKKFFADLQKVAFTGNYNDLDDRPKIPEKLPADGGNADTIDGFHASQSNIEDTAVVRNTDRSVQLGDIITDAPDDEDPIVSQILVTNGIDGHYRKSSLAHLKSSLGIAHMDRYFSYICGNGSTGLRSGYLNFMEFNTTIYDDYGIVFTIMTRSGSMARLRLIATNDNSPDPNISTFQCTSVLKGITPTDGMEVQVFLAKTAANTWNLYVYTTSYGSLAVSGFSEKNITPKKETLSSLPTGYVTPTSVSYIP